MKQVGWLVSGFLSGLLLAGCTNEDLTCGRMATLCGTEREQCKKLMEETRRQFGDDGVVAMKTCFADAQTCSEATGCVAGKGLKAAKEAAEGFFKGLMKGVKDDPNDAPKTP